MQVTAATTSSPTAGTSYTAQEGSIPSGQIGISEIDTTPVQDVATQIPATTEQITQEGTGTGSGGGSGGGGAGGGGGGGAGGSSTAKGGKSTGSGATIRPQVANAKSGNVLNLPGITNLTPGYTKGRTNYELAGQFHFATGGSVNTDQSILDKYLANLTAGIIEGDQDYTLPGYAAGGDVENHNPEFFSEGGLGSIKNRYVKGAGDGTSDSIPAMLANGEFVIPADVVSSLGNGSNDSGAHLLDEFLKTIRSHKRRADAKHLPPDSKGPLGYLLEAKKKAKK